MKKYFSNNFSLQNLYVIHILENLKRHNMLSRSIFDIAKTLDPIRSFKVACTLKLHVHKSCHSGFFLKLQWFHRIRKITSSVRHYVRSASKRYSFWWSYRRNQSKLEASIFSSIYFWKKFLVMLMIFVICFTVAYIFKNLCFHKYFYSTNWKFFVKLTWSSTIIKCFNVCGER